MIFLVFLIAQGIEIYLIPDHGTPPSPRIFCSMSYTENYNSLLVFGGSKNGIKLSDLWKFNLTTEIWIQINELSESAPSKTYLGERTGSAMMISKKNKNLLYLFGGSGIHGPLSDLWIFNIISNNWKYIADYDDFLPIYNFVYTDFIYNSSEYLCVLEFTNLLGYVFNIHL
jgi:Galactose oxidase, central domain/Kelch motif